MVSLSRATKIINQDQSSLPMTNKPKHTTFKKIRHALALIMFAGFVSMVSIILWERATLEAPVKHGSAQTSVSLDTLSNTYSQFSTPGATWRFDTTRWKQVDVDALWRYDETNDIGIELETYPSQSHDAMNLPNLIMNEIRMHKPESLFVGHEFIYKNGLVGIQLIYDAQHNGERQRYVGEYFSTPTHRVSLVAFTPLSMYANNISHIRQALLGLQPVRSPQEVNESLRWMATITDNQTTTLEDQQEKEHDETIIDGLDGAATWGSGDLPGLIDPNLWTTTTSDDLLLPHALLHKETSGILKRGTRETTQSVASFAQGYRLVLEEDGATISYTDDDITDAGYLLITFGKDNDRVPLTRMILLFPHTQGIFVCHFETLTSLFDDAKEDAKTACSTLANQDNNTSQSTILEGPGTTTVISETAVSEPYLPNTSIQSNNNIVNDPEQSSDFTIEAEANREKNITPSE